jgi:glutamate-ammonia-ligase adenylyltransferase
VPQLIQAAAEMPNPDATLSRSLDLLESISRRAAYLALLQQYPQACARWRNWSAVRAGPPSTCSAIPSCSTNCSTRACSTCCPTGAGCAAAGAKLAELEPDTERQMDLLRETHHAQVFRLLAQDVAGLYTVERWPTTCPNWPTSCSTRPCATPG